MNQGSIIGDGGTLNIVAIANGGANITNNGLIHAQNGTVNVTPIIQGTGTLQVSGTGQLNLSTGGVNNTGNLFANGVNAGSLNVGTQNVVVSIDYNNANFGVGNAFNRRANVTGAGLINASGNVAQAITGTGVTNGATAAPTLTIGNVHVGATTFNYQVANTGTTGPSLRGAIQTNVNGGNITDARLSGSGVTASNYGPIATGANSGNLAVTFTAASAGLLTPALSGQAVHIANNFDNVAQQTLGIVLGSGAAAFNLAAGSASPSPIVFGNAHVGDTRTQFLTVTNTAPASFSEKLDVGFGANTGNVSNNGGTINLLAAQASNNSALSASLDTSAAGARSGTVTLNYVSDGAGTSGLGQTNVGSQTINVAGNVYRLALANAIAGLNFGNVLVGSTQTRTVSISNLAAVDGFSESLNAAFGTLGGTNPTKFSTAGSLTGLAAGGTNNTNLVVTLNTSASGTFSANVQILLDSNGAGTSNLGITALPTQVINLDGIVTGNVGNLAQAGPATPNPVNFGNVRIGSAQNQTLSITNTAQAPAEGLNASIATNSPGVVTASGSFTGLAPQATDNSSLVVGLNTGTAGHRAGTAAITLQSDGTFNNNTPTNLPTQTVNVQGDVYRLANPVVNTPTVTVAARVGGASPNTAIGITNSSPDLFTEGLNVTRGATSAGFTSAGSITNLAAQGASNAITVSLSTATAGSFTGSQALNFVSTGAGTTNAPDVSVGNGSVTLNGKVYTPAAAQLNTPSVNFGIVHVGDAVAQQNVSVTNSAPVTALNDVLLAQFNSASAPFTGSGNLGAGLAAQQTSVNALKVGISTGAAGVYSGAASFSAASHDADLSDAALANLVVSLSGQVNNFASDAFFFNGGAGNFTQSGSIFTLDYGTVAQNSGTRTTTLLAGNNAVGPADLLDGTFQLVDVNDFNESGFSNFLNFAAGQNTGPLMLSFSSMTLGSFNDTIILHGVGHNASGFSAAIGDIQLNIRGVVQQASSNVPEPDSLLLLGLGVPLLFVRRKARRQTVH